MPTNPFAPPKEGKQKTINVQVQPILSPGLDCKATIENLLTFSTDSWANGGNENGPYINVFLRTNDPRESWARVRALLDADSALAKCSIVTCEGKHGWDDYLLLHHFDGSQPLDEISQ